MKIYGKETLQRIRDVLVSTQRIGDTGRRKMKSDTAKD